MWLPFALLSKKLFLVGAVKVSIGGVLDQRQAPGDH